MDITKATLEHCFTYKKPTGDQPKKYEALTLNAKCLAESILEHCPPSRERSLALTKLQEVRMWANASIAINEVNPARDQGVKPVRDQGGDSAGI